MIVFWKYSTFPFLLGGTVNGDIGKGGLVETVEYGPGQKFLPIFILPDEEGKELLSKLEALRAEKREAEKKLRQEFNAKLIEIPQLALRWKEILR